MAEVQETLKNKSILEMVGSDQHQELESAILDSKEDLKARSQAAEKTGEQAAAEKPSNPTTEHTREASPVGSGKQDPGSAYENQIGPIVVFMGSGSNNGESCGSKDIKKLDQI